MEKICNYCNSKIEFENNRQFGAHLTNCKLNPKKIERDIKSKRKVEFNLLCKCGEKYIINVTEYSFKCGNYKKFCSYKCSNIRSHSPETKLLISNSLKKTKGPKKTYNHICQNCHREFTTKKPSSIFCTRSCATKSKNINGLGRIAGLSSIKSQNRRSKNEVLFAEMCVNNFNDVVSNKCIFNGWDADIIIEDIKVAILWNGIWHYKKITNKHSIEQVQNRDRLKIEEIRKCGYEPYIIKDIGKHSIEKVEDEWNIFQKWISNKNIQII